MVVTRPTIPSYHAKKKKIHDKKLGGNTNRNTTYTSVNIDYRSYLLYIIKLQTLISTVYVLYKKIKAAANYYSLEPPHFVIVLNNR